MFVFCISCKTMFIFCISCKTMFIFCISYKTMYFPAYPVRPCLFSEYPVRPCLFFLCAVRPFFLFRLDRPCRKAGCSMLKGTPNDLGSPLCRKSCTEAGRSSRGQRTSSRTLKSKCEKANANNKKKKDHVVFSCVTCKMFFSCVSFFHQRVL